MCIQCVATGTAYAAVPLGAIYARATVRIRRKKRAKAGDRQSATSPAATWLPAQTSSN